MSANGKPYGYFWNSDNGDRTYDAESFEEWTKTFFTTGVMPDTYVVQKTAGATRGVEVVNLGYCNVNGKVWKPDTSTVPVTIATASSQYPRIDSVVIERNDADRAFYIKVVTGSLSGDTPVAPAPVRSGGVYQLVLAHIYVAAGSTTIETANITDTRANASLCGWITGTVDEIDISQLLAQSTEQFDAWFQEMKNQLSEDAAGNLQLEIDGLDAEKVGKRVVNYRAIGSTGTGDLYRVVIQTSWFVPPAPGCSKKVTVEDVLSDDYIFLGVVGLNITDTKAEGKKRMTVSGFGVAYYDPDRTDFDVEVYNLGSEGAGAVEVTLTLVAMHKDFLNQ